MANKYYAFIYAKGMVAVKVAHNTNAEAAKRVLKSCGLSVRLVLPEKRYLELMEMSMDDVRGIYSSRAQNKENGYELEMILKHKTEVQ